MNDSVNHKRLETLKHQLCDELVDDAGNPPDAEDVEAVVTNSSERLADAPIQDFVPLLVEHEARQELRSRGLHRELADDEDSEAAPGSTDEDTESHQRMLEWKTTPHL